MLFNFYEQLPIHSTMEGELCKQSYVELLDAHHIAGLQPRVERSKENDLLPYQVSLVSEKKIHSSTYASWKGQ